MEEVEFTANGERIERVEEFRYLGRILTESDDDSKCIQEQLRKARGRCWCIAKLLKREAANPFKMGRFYMAVFQVVLLYRSEPWAVSQKNMGALECFQKKAVCYMIGSHIQWDGKGG